MFKVHVIKLVNSHELAEYCDARLVPNLCEIQMANRRVSYLSIGRLKNNASAYVNNDKSKQHGQGTMAGDRVYDVVAPL